MSLTTEQHPMTEVEYASIGGSCCPYCKSTQIAGGSVDVNAGGAYQEVSCGACDKEWTDTYALTGYQET
ncbi:hypothetical protein [Massilia sp. TN1-12]|uniref:hypothetical protein n=1 Tax=Massilia paldalensis TaxID=3377675 RepID=UPI00384F222D